MNQEIKKRLLWIKLFGETQNAGIVCRRCGISRPTLRKWLRRYKNRGLEGLIGQNRRPIQSPAKKVFLEQEQWILDLRKNRNSGARCIQNELRRIHGFNLSLATIHKVLTKHRVKPLVRLRRGFIRNDIAAPSREIESKWIPARSPAAFTNTRRLMIARGTRS
jgi:transposase